MVYRILGSGEVPDIDLTADRIEPASVLNGALQAINNAWMEAQKVEAKVGYSPEAVVCVRLADGSLYVASSTGDAELVANMLNGAAAKLGVT